LREGDAAATQGMAQQVSAKIEQLSRSIEQLALHRGKIQREAEPELVRLSMAIARRILRRELSVDPDSLHGLIKVGLEKIEASVIRQTPLGRLGGDTDLMGAAVYLASDASRHVTGQYIAVDGGASNA